jgi:glycine/D-amino acid oxidase-like deaminating enzyme
MTHFSNDVLWNNRPWSAFESLQRDAVCDVCVIGLGASGLTAIQHLVAAGRTVIGIDAHMVGHGAAGSNGGFILAGIAAFHHDAVAQLGHARATDLYRQTIAEIAHLAHAEPSFRQTGSLRIACDATEYADCVEQYRIMRADGLAVEQYAGPEGEGLLFPGDGVFQPLERVRRLAQSVHAAGAQLYERSLVTDVRPGEVRVGAHRIHAEHIIVAVDGALERIFPQLSNEVRTTRLQMIGTAPDHQSTLSRPVYYRYGYDYWQQLRDGRIVIGGSRDRHADSEWGYATGPSHAVQHDIEHTLRTVVGSHAPVTHRWGASVAYHITDVRPLVREIMPRVWACGAYNGTGNVVGTIVNRLVTEVIVHGHAPALAVWQE